MTLYQFNALNEKNQAEAIFEHGVFLGSRTEGEYTHALYQIDSFYAEIHYQSEQNEIKGARVFTNPDLLQPYLEQMTITL